MLALNSLFILVQEHNLDYPEFFPRLYALLDHNVLSTKYRSRFFRLLHVFLGSSLLSSSLVSAFLKRLARLCLLAPPSGILIVLPLIYNLFRVHPSCIRLIHCGEGGDVMEGFGLSFHWNVTQNNSLKQTDPYNPKEPNPEASGADQSYLWELVSLQSHYHPSVATLAKIFSQPLTAPAYDLEDFLDLTYDDLIQQERKGKNSALAIHKRRLIE